jgi:beta-lactam-binding protein with PASTA domain
MNPFHASGSVSATDRLDMIKRMTVEQLQAALQVDGLQATVKRAVTARLKRLQKEPGQ